MDPSWMVQRHTCPLLRSVTPADELPSDSMPSLSYVPHSEVVKTEPPEPALKKAKSSSPAPPAKISAVKGAAVKPGGDPVRTPNTKCKGEIPCLTPSPPPKAVPKAVIPPTKIETSGISQLTKPRGVPVPKPSSRPNQVKTIPSVPKPMATPPSVYLSKPVAPHVKHDLPVAGPTHKSMTGPPPKPSCKEELTPSATLLGGCVAIDSDDDVASTVADADPNFEKDVQDVLDEMAKENNDEIPVPPMVPTSQPGIGAPVVSSTVPVEVPVAEATPAATQVEKPGDQASAPAAAAKPAATPVGASAAAEKPVATAVEKTGEQTPTPEAAAEKSVATPPAEKSAITPAPDKAEAETTPHQAQGTPVASTSKPTPTKPAFTPLEPSQALPPTTMVQHKPSNTTSTTPATAAPAKASPELAPQESVPPAPEKKLTQEEKDEQWIRARFEKMDDAETKRYLKAAKKHPLLQQYVHEDLGLGATLKDAKTDYDYVFGDADDTEELICFELWLLRKSRIPSSTPAAAGPAAVPKQTPQSQPKPVPPKSVPTVPTVPAVPPSLKPTAPKPNDQGERHLNFEVVGNVSWPNVRLDSL